MILLGNKQNSLILLGFFHFLGWRSPYIVLVSAPPGQSIILFCILRLEDMSTDNLDYLRWKVKEITSGHGGSFMEKYPNNFRKLFTL